MSHTSKRKPPLQRYLEIILLFESHESPLSPQEIFSHCYPHLKKNDAGISFGRDRLKLEELGYRFEYDDSRNVWRMGKADLRLQLPRLEDRDAAALAIAASPMLYEESFPLHLELGLALAKLTSSHLASRFEFEDDLMISSMLTFDENLEEQAEICAQCIDAYLEQREVSFNYKKADGELSSRAGFVRSLHYYNGQWYVLCSALNDDEAISTYSIANISNFVLGEAHPNRSFEPVDISTAFPFMWGEGELGTCEIIIPARLSAQLENISLGFGDVRAAEKSDCADFEAGSLIWTVPYRNEAYLFRYILERGFRIAAGSRAEHEALLNYIDAAVKANG